MSLFEKVLEEELLKRERLRQETLFKTKKVLRKLREKVFFEKAYIFGSLVCPGEYSIQSDIDIAFEKLEPNKLFYTVAFLSSELGREVDVIELEKAPSFFREKVLKEGILWKPD